MFFFKKDNAGYDVHNGVWMCARMGKKKYKRM